MDDTEHTLNTAIRQKSVEARVMQMVKERDEKLKYKKQFADGTMGGLSSKFPISGSLSKSSSA